MAQEGAFARFVREYGAKEEKEEQEEEAIEGAGEDEKEEKEPKKVTAGLGLMQAEERNTGAVTGTIYKEYLKAGRGSIIIPSLLLSFVLLQGAQVMSSYW